MGWEGRKATSRCDVVWGQADFLVAFPAGILSSLADPTLTTIHDLFIACQRQLRSPKPGFTTYKKLSCGLVAGLCGYILACKETALYQQQCLRNLADCITCIDAWQNDHSKYTYIVFHLYSDMQRHCRYCHQEEQIGQHTPNVKVPLLQFLIHVTLSIYRIRCYI